MAFEWGVRIVNNVIHAKFGTNGRYETAYELYVRACELDEYPETVAEAEDLYWRALRLDPTMAVAYVNLGNIRYSGGAPNDALEYYRRAIAISPLLPDAHYNTGFVLVQQEKLEEAISFFKKTIEMDRKHEDAYYHLATAWERLGDIARMRVQWKFYLKINPNGRWVDEARQKLDESRDHLQVIQPSKRSQRKGP